MKYVRELCPCVVHILCWRVCVCMEKGPVWQKFLMCLFIKLFHIEMHSTKKAGK